MTCKDCIHYPVCSTHNNLEYVCEQSIRDDCEYFMRADNTVEVCRCKDCVNYCQNPYSTRKSMWCMYWADWNKTEPDDFCRGGERRENDK